MSFLSAPEVFLFLKAHFPVSYPRQPINDLFCEKSQEAILTAFGMNFTDQEIPVSSYT